MSDAGTRGVHPSYVRSFRTRTVRAVGATVYLVFTVGRRRILAVPKHPCRTAGDFRRAYSSVERFLWATGAPISSAVSGDDEETKTPNL